MFMVADCIILFTRDRVQQNNSKYFFEENIWQINFISYIRGRKKKGHSVETERPLTIACHMKKFKNSVL